MERTGTRILALVALLSLLGGARAARTEHAQATPSCDAAALAARVATSCAVGAPTGPCCEAVLAPLDAGARGGGASSCICRVAAQPRLGNVSYATILQGCSRAGAAATSPPLPEICAPHGAITKLAAAPEQVGAGCDAGHLASDIAESCPKGVSVGCCKSVLAAVDIKGCICSVQSERDIVTSQFSMESLIKLYIDCGGVRPLKETMECEEVQQAERGTCAAVPSTCTSAVVSPSAVSIATLVMVCVVFVGLLCQFGLFCYMAYRLHLAITSRSN